MIYCCINHTDAERQAVTIRECPVCTQARIDALRVELAAARTSLEKLAYLSRNRRSTRIDLRDAIQATLDAAGLHDDEILRRVKAEISTPTR